MTQDADDPAADLPTSAETPMLLVSVWFDTPGQDGFRARVSATTVEGSLTTLHVTANPTTVPAAVEAWLTRLLRESQPATEED